jgi:hypothetical protein
MDSNTQINVYYGIMKPKGNDLLFNSVRTFKLLKENEVTTTYNCYKFQNTEKRKHKIICEHF